LKELQDDTVIEIFAGSYWCEICWQYESKSSCKIRMYIICLMLLPTCFMST